MTLETTEERFDRLLHENVISELEHDALTHRYVDQLSERNTALALGISRATLRDRIWNAHRKIGLHSQETT